MTVYENFCPDKTNLNFSYQRVRNLKKYSNQVVNFWNLHSKSAFSFFRISHSLLPKIEICLKYFLDKNFQKQPLWKRRKRSSRLHEIGAAEHMADKKLVKLQGELRPFK